MTTFFLIRHASNDLFKHTLVGRSPGVYLNEIGKSEAKQLAVNLAVQDLTHILTSPLERCVETAQPIAKRLNLKVEHSEPLKEVNFGDWTGRKFAELGGTCRMEALECVPLRLSNSQRRNHARSPGARS